MTEKQPSLSYSRMAEYQQCPLKYRLSMVDRLPQPPRMPLIFGTAVHQVLEDLFALPARERTLPAALEMVSGAVTKTLDERPDSRQLIDTPEAQTQLTQRVTDVVTGYFQIERPAALTNGGRETEVTGTTDQGVTIRGFIDRIDIAPNGALRVVDYKTGKVPRPQYSAKHLNQLRFYSLLLSKRDGNAPARAQLVYVEHGQVMTLDPTDADIARIESDINETWARIEADLDSQRFLPTKNPLCNWCDYQQICPAFGGQLPDFPTDRAQYLLGTRTTQ